MNVADSELVAGIMEREGYVKTVSHSDADVILLNTCAIREHAQEKIHSRLGVLKKLKSSKPELLLGVLGCMAQHLKDDILENKRYVDFVLGPDSYRRLPELLNRRTALPNSVVDARLSRYEVYDDLFPSRAEGVNAWVCIMRGCDKFCTFCVVPFTRGRERSRSVESIAQEVNAAAAAGFVEITLLGQNVNSYRHSNSRFPDLLSVIATVPGILRVRFTSPHPSDVDDELLFVMRENPNICKSIHLPLQAGSDRILHRMNRTYSQGQYLRLVDRIRQILPGCAVTTDIIVGFPGETAGEFGETLKVMETVKFDSAYTFKYSPRPSTKAAQYADQIPEEEKQIRLEQVIALQKKHTLMRNREEIGGISEVLVEKISKKSQAMWAGRTSSNKWVIFPKGDAKPKDLVRVRITAAHGVTLFGEQVEKREYVDAVT